MLRKSQPTRFRDSHSGVPGEKSHLDVGSVASHRVYNKWEGDGFPQIRAVVSLVCPCCPWLVLALKVLQLCTNHFVWVVCRPMWVNEACQLFLVPSRNSNMPFYPSKCCELGSVSLLLLFPLSSTWTHIWVLQGLQGVGSRHGACGRWQRPTWKKRTSDTRILPTILDESWSFKKGMKCGWTSKKFDCQKV